MYIMYVYDSTYFLEGFSITGTTIIQYIILNGSSKQNHQQPNCCCFIFTIPYIIDIVISRRRGVFCKYVHSITAAENLNIRKNASSNRNNNRQTVSVSYLPSCYFSILFSPDKTVSYANIYTRCCVRDKHFRVLSGFSIGLFPFSFERYYCNLFHRNKQPEINNNYFRLPYGALINISPMYL